MDELTPFERRLAIRLRADAERVVRPIDAREIARSVVARNRSRHRGAFGGYRAGRGLRLPRLDLFAAVAVTAIVVLAVVGLSLRSAPSVGGPPGMTEAVPSPTQAPTATPAATPPLTPGPTATPPYPVTVPEGVAPRSAPAQVERAALEFVATTPRAEMRARVPAPRRVVSMEWLAPGVEYEAPTGGTLSSGEPSWVVEIAGHEAGNTRVLVFLTDGTLDVWGSDP